METIYVVYICDLCFKAINNDSARAVWVIDDCKHDVCAECILRLTPVAEDENAG